MYVEQKDNMKGLFPEPVTLSGGALSLRPLALSDAKDLRRLTEQEEVYRLLREEWGKGTASEALRLMTGELLNVRGIEIITASTMAENRASARVLEKNGFQLVTRGALEDWGYPEPTPADKWFL